MVKMSYRRQPRYSADESSSLQVSYLILGKIGEVQGETTETVVTARRERGRKEGSDASSCKIKLYVLQQDVTTATKKQGQCALIPMCSIC